ncbi:hypothetical protein OKJ48_10895 [Streptomyces kunmingensis]|uniref:Uncharacterized protein n=1 Tax=Streptomyces kunmingensis TaxID=68225 RepID=A0ABU6C7R9_9ACTN|nr:hypothetical protein [Streptomyces kunmingensis]MEB3960744.1 hypothetical protein [Streptomyces kunmingensis]
MATPVPRADGANGPRLYDYWAAARLQGVWELDGDEPTRHRWMLARAVSPDPKRSPTSTEAGCATAWAITSAISDAGRP